MHFTAQQIAELLEGSLEGNADVTVTRLSKIEEGGPGSLSFLANPAYTQYLYSTTASLVIVARDLALTGPVQATLLRVESPEKAFAKLLGVYNTLRNDRKGVSPKAEIGAGSTYGSDCYIGALAFIGDNVRIGNNVKIHPQCFIGDNVTIGDSTTLHAGVKVYADCVIGARCIIHSGTVIGSDGFRFALGEGAGEKVPQIGNVVLEDDVELGANCAIDRATLGSTILRKGVKFDNLIHIAHNVEVGENTLIAAAGVIAGSTKVGRNCMFSGQVGVVGHLKIADNTILAAGSGVSKSITKPGGAYMGSPAFEITRYRKAYVHFRNLEALAERITKLEERSPG
jgi:UDP-3-O-[3-hydroxymyristoyl] glucosamine N-acyltransferase